MNIKNELAEIEKRMFNEDFLDKILAAYKQEMEDTGAGMVEQEYIDGWKTLDTILTDEEKSDLAKAESLYKENMLYAMRYSFVQGNYTGFQQFFVEKTPDDPFRTQVTEQLTVSSYMKQHTDYYNKMEACNQIFDQIEKRVGAGKQEPLISIESALENRLYGVMRYSFYTGYRYALSTISEATPVGSPMKIIGKVLLTEYSLGFIKTKGEIEKGRA